MRIRSRFLTILVARLAAVVMRLLFRSCRIKLVSPVSGIIPYEETGSRRYLYNVWHDQLIIPIFAGPQCKTGGLVSQHQDGSYLADLMKIAGMIPVRGSSSRGGARAMRELIEQTQDIHIVITPDGPRGPRREMKTGIVFLASHSGREIVCVASACRRSWRIKGSWTDLVIPKPFTTVYLCAAEPIQVPRRLKREGLDHFTGAVQAAMDRLQEEAEALARGQEPAVRPQQQNPAA